MRSGVKKRCSQEPALHREGKDDHAQSEAKAPAEKALPGGGRADSATDANADHQFQGVE